MKPLPTGPELQAQIMAALQSDLFDLGAGKAKSFQRLDALHQISREDRAAEKAAGNNQ